MSYFQNVFAEDFHGTIYGVGEEESPQNWVMRANGGRTREAVFHWQDNVTVSAGETPRYDLSGSGDDDLTIAWSHDGVTFTNFVIDITANSAADSSVSPAEIVQSLNESSPFASLWVASVIEGPPSLKQGTNVKPQQIMIKQNSPATHNAAGTFYIENVGAEAILQFNRKAPVKQLLSFFQRHIINATGSNGRLLYLDVTDGDAQNVLDMNGIASASSYGLLADYQLLKGAVPTYQFIKNTYTGTDLTTQIVYNAGAVAGDPAIKTTMVYASNKMTESHTVPHVLVSGDLITP